MWNSVLLLHWNIWLFISTYFWWVRIIWLLIENRSISNESAVLYKYPDVPHSSVAGGDLSNHFSLIYRWWYVKSGHAFLKPSSRTSNAGCSNCSPGHGLLITVQVKQEIRITWNRKFILLCVPGCVSSDQSLLISVLFHLIETHTHTHRTCGLWSPGVRRMDHFLYASFKLTAVFKRKSI